ncbi:YbaB/EbfC family nucleoid-associated protein [Amycolatopsis pittospori]|uniref:YbaB/EbfC family nucleoid-associated protein n=1 Tax=Amycolatopsis pittospori TaxID=2749434 RepID=UPI002E2DF6E9|nr:YbaB/EbfC family nucleoid-associated protein [Amycolatopsis pittospori]
MEPSFDSDMYADYERLAEDVRTMQERLAAIRATVDSDDGLISATVGGAGELIELWLDPRVYRTLDSAALAESITGTIHRAAGVSQKEGLTIAAGFLPPESTVEAADLRFGPALHRLDRPSGGR